MIFSQLSIGRTFCLPFYLLMCSACLNNVFAEAIYQWSDPWGHIQYSKTQAPGSMLSNLTELPKQQKVTEQQKQKAMLNKIQKIDKANSHIQQENATKQFIQQQIRNKEAHCRKLRTLLSDVRLRNARLTIDYYYYPGHPNYRRHNYSDEVLERDLYWQIREHCR